MNRSTFREVTPETLANARQQGVFTMEQQEAWSRANARYLYAVGRSQDAADKALAEMHALEHQQDLERQGNPRAALLP